jgi:hypothetical protein
MQSPDNTVISTVGQSIVDSHGDTWTILADQVAVNGTVDPTTANVIELAYENGQIWQKNTDNLWWGKTSAAAAWNPPDGTQVNPVANQKASANDSVVTVLSGVPTASLTDATGNIWSILNGQVTLNGVADGTTRNVSELAYVDGLIWQKNADDLWWSKGKPSDPWGPTNGTTENPISGTTKNWIGGTANFDTATGWTPGGVPQNGDTAVVASGNLQVMPGSATGVDFNLQGGEVTFNLSGTFNTGSWTGNGTILVGYPGQTVAVTTTGIDLAGTQLVVDEFISGTNSFAIHGNSNLTGGAVLATQLVGTGSLPRGALENDGTMTVDSSSLQAGVLSGQGIVRATGNSTISVISAGSDETIQLVAAHLDIGGGPVPASTAMQFLAPITEFGDSSEIVLNNTQATQAIFAKSSPTAGELFLYNGSALVADLHISGQGQLYATDIPAGLSSGSVLLTAYDTGHSIPMTTTGA